VELILTIAEAEKIPSRAENARLSGSLV